MNCVKRNLNINETLLDVGDITLNDDIYMLAN